MSRAAAPATNCTARLATAAAQASPQHCQRTAVVLLLLLLPLLLPLLLLLLLPAAAAALSQQFAS
jgi:hypothetical protein